MSRSDDWSVLAPSTTVSRALRESERELRLVVDSIAGVVAVFTPGGELAFANRWALDYCGQPLDDLKHWGTNGTIHPDDVPRIVSLFTHSIASGEPFVKSPQVIA